MALTETFTIDEIATMFSTMCDLEPDNVVEGNFLLLSLIYRAKAAQKYQKETGDHSMTIKIIPTSTL